jgi:hypothetical protein
MRAESGLSSVSPSVPGSPPTIAVTTFTSMGAAYCLRRAPDAAMSLPGGASSWTVPGPGRHLVGPAEEFLECLRVRDNSPNTVDFMS